jgi:hypothetical protein
VTRRYLAAIRGHDRRQPSETAMIKPRRVGHATFETNALERQITSWTEVAGLVPAERE